MASTPLAAPDSQTGLTITWSVIPFGVLLSYALLSPNPLWFVGAAPDDPTALLDRAVPDVMQHFGAYCFFSALCVWCTRRQSAAIRLYVPMLVLEHGLLTEWLQAFVPYRTCDPADALANAAGTLLGAVTAVIGSYCDTRCSRNRLSLDVSAAD